MRWKLEALAAHGLRVTAASTVPRRKASAALTGVRLLRVPSYREPRGAMLVGAVWDAVPLLIRPRRLRALVRAVRTPLPPSDTRPSWVGTIELMRKYLRLARAEPDIVHFEWESAACHYLPLMEVWDCPVVVSCLGSSLDAFPHGTRNQRWLSRLPLAFAKAAAVHCVSEATREQALRFGAAPGKTRVIRPAVDASFFKPRAKPAAATRLRVLSIGRLVWGKGHEYALVALADLIERGVPAHLQLVGDGEDRDRILATAHDLHLSSHVEMLGWLEPSEVVDRLHDSDVLLHASLVEGLPNVVLEAMACGLPVVATDVMGTREALTDGREGFLVGPREAGAMAAALEALWKDPSLRHEMGRLGRERIESEFTLAQQIPRIAALYEHAADRSSAPSTTDSLVSRQKIS